MTKVSFNTSYIQLTDYMNQLRVNLDLFSIRGQKKAGFEARKNLQSMVKVAKSLRKEIQDSKKSMPTRKRVLRNEKPAPVAAKKPAGKPVVAKKQAAEADE